MIKSFETFNRETPEVNKQHDIAQKLGLVSSIREQVTSFDRKNLNLEIDRAASRKFESTIVNIMWARLQRLVSRCFALLWKLLISKYVVFLILLDISRRKEISAIHGFTSRGAKEIGGVYFHLFRWECTPRNFHYLNFWTFQNFLSEKWGFIQFLSENWMRCLANT